MKSYEPAADRALDRLGRFDAVTEEDLWRAYRTADHEGWGSEWLLDHEDCKLPTPLRDALDDLRADRADATRGNDVFERALAMKYPT